MPAAEPPSCASALPLRSVASTCASTCGGSQLTLGDALPSTSSLAAGVVSRSCSIAEDAATLAPPLSAAAVHVSGAALRSPLPPLSSAAGATNWSCALPPSLAAAITPCSAPQPPPPGSCHGSTAALWARLGVADVIEL